MFLRIEVYPGGLQYVATAKVGDDPAPARLLGPSTPTRLFAYPSLVKEDGKTLLEVGRKESNDILFAQDKSVSRMHCQFTLSRSDGDAASKTTTPTLVTLETLGKTGCFVVAERPRAPPPSGNGSEKDDGNDSDATDVDADAGTGALTQHVGGAASQTQRPAGEVLNNPPLLSESAVRALRDRGLDPNMYHLETVKVDQSRALKELDTDNAFVIVQCGKFESTLVLTRKDFVVPIKCKSLVDATLLESVGARLEPNLSGPITHYVTKKYSASAQMLMAWCRRVEFVTPDYFLTLTERVSPSDAMPDLDDYRPSPSSASSNEDFWFKAPPSWAGWTFVAPARPSAEESIEWMRSIHAQARTVDTMSDLEEMLHATANLEPNDAPRTTKYFATTHKQWLTKAKLEKAGVVFCDIKTLASRLVKFLAPDGTPLNATVGPPPSISKPAVAMAAVDQPEGEQKSNQPPKVHTEHTSDQPEESAGVDGVASDARVTVESNTTPVHPSRRSSKRAMESSLPNSEPAAQRQNTVAEPTLDVGAGDRHVGDVSPSNEINDEDRYNEIVARPRKLAKPSSDGWFVHIDPKRRKGGDSSAYVRRKSNAVTEVVKGIVLQQPLGQNRSNAAGSAPRRSREAVKVDFRGFRKNHVAQARGNFASISFVSVQPKETQVAIQIEEQRHQLEERQRMADELFRDPEFPGGRAKQRR